MILAADIPRTRLTTAGLDLFDHAEQAGRRVAAPPPQNPCTLPADPPPEAMRIRSVLATRIGRHQAITAPQIAQAAGLWPELRDADRGTKVREMVTAWLEYVTQPGMVPVADSSGYWLTDDPEDITHYCQTLRSRGRETFLRERRIRMLARMAGLTYHGHGHWARP
jgi:hypothetical protein